MTEIDYTTQILQIIQIVIYSILNTTVQVDSEYTLRTSTYTTGAKRITESVISNLVAQTAAA